MGNAASRVKPAPKGNVVAAKTATARTASVAKTESAVNRVAAAKKAAAPIANAAPKVAVVAPASPARAAVAKRPVVAVKAVSLSRAKLIALSPVEVVFSAGLNFYFLSRQRIENINLLR